MHNQTNFKPIFCYIIFEREKNSRRSLSIKSTVNALQQHIILEKLKIRECFGNKSLKKEEKYVIIIIGIIYY